MKSQGQDWLAYGLSLPGELDDLLALFHQMLVLNTSSLVMIQLVSEDRNTDHSLHGLHLIHLLINNCSQSSDYVILDAELLIS